MIKIVMFPPLPFSGDYQLQMSTVCSCTEEFHIDILVAVSKKDAKSVLIFFKCLYELLSALLTSPLFSEEGHTIKRFITSTQNKKIQYTKCMLKCTHTTLSTCHFVCICSNVYRIVSFSYIFYGTTIFMTDSKLSIKNCFLSLLRKLFKKCVPC